MNKAQFVEAIALDANISKIDARKAVDAMIRVTVQSLREVIKFRPTAEVE